MKLLTAEIRAQLPVLYAQSESSDAIVYVKFFNPNSDWTWYATNGTKKSRNPCGSSNLQLLA
jgi:hypothetical protein